MFVARFLLADEKKRKHVVLNKRMEKATAFWPQIVYIFFINFKIEIFSLRWLTDAFNSCAY